MSASLQLFIALILAAMVCGLSALVTFQLEYSRAAAALAAAWWGPHLPRRSHRVLKFSGRSWTVSWVRRWPAPAQLGFLLGRAGALLPRVTPQRLPEARYGGPRHYCNASSKQSGAQSRTLPISSNRENWLRSGWSRIVAATFQLAAAEAVRRFASSPHRGPRSAPQRAGRQNRLRRR